MFRIFSISINRLYTHLLISYNYAIFYKKFQKFDALSDKLNFIPQIDDLHAKPKKPLKFYWW